jgi:DNA-binding PadR family transcriptional regulator
MAKRVTKAKFLTERDLALMNWIGSGGLASLNQLHVKFWTNAKERTCRERLLQLEKAGMLKTHFVDARVKGEQVFTLTPKGAKEFSALERKFFFTKLPQKHELKQQLISQDIRIKLERDLVQQGKKLVTWKNEHQLRSEAHHATGKKFGNSAGIPDARAVIETEEGEAEEIDLEIDGQYYGKMLGDKLGALANSGRGGIWVTTKARAGKIAQLLGGLGASSVKVVTV